MVIVVIPQNKYELQFYNLEAISACLNVIIFQKYLKTVGFHDIVHHATERLDWSQNKHVTHKGKWQETSTFWKHNYSKAHENAAGVSLKQLSLQVTTVFKKNFQHLRSLTALRVWHILQGLTSASNYTFQQYIDLLKKNKNPPHHHHLTTDFWVPTYIVLVLLHRHILVDEASLPWTFGNAVR